MRLLEKGKIKKMLMAFGLELRVWRLLGGNRYIVVYPPQGLGDILQVLMHLQGLKAIYPGKKVALVITKPHFLELAKLYHKVTDKFLYLSQDQCEILAKSRYGELFRSSWWKVYDEKSPRLYFHYAVMAAYGIPAHTPAYIPKIQASRKTLRHLNSLGIKNGGTVIIAPEAVSCDEVISLEVWMKVAVNLEGQGFKVFFNSRNEAYGKERLLFLPLQETLHAITQGGGFIGYRSGLCDVVSAFTKSRQIIVYPNNRKPGEYPSIMGYDQNPNEKYMEYCSLNNIYPDKEIRELIYSEDGLLSAVKEVFGNGQDSH